MNLPPFFTVVGHHAERPSRLDPLDHLRQEARNCARRLGNACDMLANGKKRVCCFDPSGIYSGEFSASPAVD